MYSFICPPVLINISVTTSPPGVILYEDTFIDLICNVTVSGDVDTPVNISLPPQWEGPDPVTDDADYDINGSTLRINKLSISRDNGRNITCRSTVVPTSVSQFILQNSIQASIQLTVTGKDTYYTIVVIIMFHHVTTYRTQ